MPSLPHSHLLGSPMLEGCDGLDRPSQLQETPQELHGAAFSNCLLLSFIPRKKRSCQCARIPPPQRYGRLLVRCLRRLTECVQHLL